MLEPAPHTRVKPIDSILVVFGAIPGALLRWQVNDNLIVNLFGAALLGMLVSFPVRYRFMLILGVGFCGSLTTFSSWIVTCLDLVISDKWIDAASLLFGTLLIGLFFAALGFCFGKFLSHLKLFRWLLSARRH